MSIQVVIYFWPNKNIGFGHIAASVYEIINDEIIREEYISWCHNNSRKYDVKKYGNDYITVKLPEHNNVDFKDFITQYATSCYFNNLQLIDIFTRFKNAWNPKFKLEENIKLFHQSFIDESAKNLESDFTHYCYLEKKPKTETSFKNFITEKYLFFENTKVLNDWNHEISFLKNIENLIRHNLDNYLLKINYLLNIHKLSLFNDKNLINENIFNRIINAQNEYNFISNNCTHAIEYILSITGYQKKAKKAFFLTPTTTFNSACELALVLQQQARKNIEANKNDNYFNNIKQLINKDIQILQIGVPSASSLKKIAVLNKLLESSKVDEFLKQLYIAAYKYKDINKSLSNSLIDYVSYIPPAHQKPILLAEIKIHIALDKMLDKANLLEEQNSKIENAIIPPYAFIVKKLVADLRHKTNTYFSQLGEINILDLESFKADCKQIIEQAEPVLATHRGWKHLLAAVALTIATLGIGSLIVCVVNKISTGRFSFFHTQSHVKLIHLKKTIQQVDESSLTKKYLCI